MSDEPRNSLVIAPGFIPPQMPRRVRVAPAGDRWAHEIKHDGWRLQLTWLQGVARAFSRTGLDYTARVPAFGSAFAKLAARDAILDGELVAVKASGHSSFVELQRALRARRFERVFFYAFDVLFIDGVDLRNVAYEQRKAQLKALLEAQRENTRIHYVEYLTGDGREVFSHAEKLGLEGIVSKRLGSKYVSGASETWLKTKSRACESFIVIGWDVERGGVACVHLGRYAQDRLVYAGSVRSGLGRWIEKDLRTRCEPRLSPACALPELTGKQAWVEPSVVVEVEFTTRSAEGRYRNASLRGVREDEDARLVTTDRTVRRSI